MPRCAPYAGPLAVVALLFSSPRASADDGSTSGGATTEPPPSEVRVLAPHREVGATTLRRDDTRDVPGALGDPTRLVEALPGVAPTTSGLQAFFVRGAPPTATGSFIDGVPVPALYHIGFGPSVVHPALLERAEFFEGAAPARYGRFVGGVLSGTTRAPEPRGHGEANLRAFDAGALVEEPWAGGSASALAAARYGYPGLVVPLFQPDVGLSYWDYQARVTWSPDDRDRLGAFAFGSHDRLTQREEVGGQSVDGQLVADEFHRADLRWDRALGRHGTMRLALTLGRDAVGNENANGTDDIARLRLELDGRFSSTLRVRGGADAQLDRLRPAAPPAGAVLFGALAAIVPSRDDAVAGAHVDVAWRVHPRVEIVPGLRADVFTTRTVPAFAQSHDATPTFDPRIAVRSLVATDLTVVSTFGLAHERPGLFVPVPDATPLLQPGVQDGVQSSAQASQGVELALPAHFWAAVTFFLHAYSGLADVTFQGVPGAAPGELVKPTVNGRAFGGELLVRRPLTDRLAVWVSYTLSRSTRQARPYDSSVASMTIPSEYDRTHVVTVAASLDLGREWRAGARLYAYSGRPYTQTSLGVQVIPYNSARLPGFYRVDARLEKAWRLAGGDRIALVFEGVNVTLNTEAVSAACGFSVTGGTTGGGRSSSGTPLDPCSIDRLGPITIPSVGVEGTFR
ncbi:MAG TPA: TonB-dependent receptor plug domain-containing protein [Polyangiaceae bacterium]|nr:TonB-dependent receptor plug domain-containing protein [Polyangiaceae bacterium]